MNALKLQEDEKPGETPEAPGVEDGGPAFPRPDVFSPDGSEFIHGQRGMSLRDYIAIRAMHAIMMRDTESWSGPHRYAGLAKQAYSISDAMLKARKAVAP